ncbi:MAG: hypothetical protein ACE5OZ_04680 [Candidatus Heimdallarchaeota archaeon]
MVKRFQKYDQQAAVITRRIRSPRMNRYTWQAKNKVDFQDLANKISKVNKKGVWKLYQFIHQSERLEEINESLQHGHTSLKTHILLAVNLIVQEFLNSRNLAQESD